MVDFCKHGNETLGSIGAGFLDHQEKLLALKDSASWSYFKGLSNAPLEMLLHSFLSSVK